jgi:hypothetical protein
LLAVLLAIVAIGCNPPQDSPRAPVALSPPIEVEIAQVLQSIDHDYYKTSVLYKVDGDPTKGTISDPLHDPFHVGPRERIHIDGVVENHQRNGDVLFACSVVPVDRPTLERITSKTIGRPLAIILGGRAIVSPILNSSFDAQLPIVLFDSSPADDGEWIRRYLQMTH